MNDFFAPDLVFTGHMGFPTGPFTYPDRDTFLSYDISHPWAYERLTPLDLALDENQTIKVKKVPYFPERMPPGVLTGGDVLGRPPRQRSE